MLSADPLSSQGGSYGYPQGGLEAFGVPGEAAPPVAAASKSPTAAAAAAVGPVIAVRISRAEESQSLMMQKYTAYIVEITDFGRKFEVSRRYSDFASLHSNLLNVWPQLPGMPPKGLDGSDPMVVKARKHDLEQLLQHLMRIPEVLMDKDLNLWKFLELKNPSVLCGRFVMVPRSREAGLKQLAKLAEPKYADEVYRIGNPAIIDILVQIATQIRDQAGQSPNRAPCCQLLQVALQKSEAARARILDAGGISILLGILERCEVALDEVRAVLNVVIAREGDKFCDRLATFLDKGGLQQLQNLCVMTPKISEFVAKLLWLAWEAPVRSRLAGPSGMPLLGALLGIPAAPCRLLGTALLAGLVCHGDLSGERRTEALRHCRAGVAQPVKPDEIDSAFVKALCGTQTTVGRMAALLEDPETATIALGMLCRVKPPAASITRIAGNLAGVVGNLGGAAHNEEARARAAELLLYIDTAAENKDAPFDLERCQGLAQYEESLEMAIQLQLRETVQQQKSSMEKCNALVAANAEMVRSRLSTLPRVNEFHDAFQSALTSFTGQRDQMQKLSQEAQTIHHEMNGKLHELSRGPAITDDSNYKERLTKAEQAYAEVKERKDALSVQEQAFKAVQGRADAAAVQLRAADAEVMKFQKDMDELMRAKLEKENEASKLRHKASTPNIDGMKANIQASITDVENKLRNLQTAAQRVQQGDPDYLAQHESRDQKMAQLQQQNQVLRRQHAQYQQQMKDLNFDPQELLMQAEKFDSEAREKQIALLEIQGKRSEVERDRDMKRMESQKELDQARSDKMQYESMHSQAKLLEDSLRAQMAALQPQMRERHMKLQRELNVKDQLDGDQVNLGVKIRETCDASSKEGHSRNGVRRNIQVLIEGLQRLDQSLAEIENATSICPGAEGLSENDYAKYASESLAPLAGIDEPIPQLTQSGVPPPLAERTRNVFDEPPARPAAAPAPPANVFADESSAVFADQSPPQLVAHHQPSPAAALTADSFDDFLNDNPAAPAPALAPQPAAAPAPAAPADAVGDGFDF